MIANKDISKLDNLKLNKYDKMLLKKRCCVEHSRKNFVFSFNKHVINRFKQF